MHGLGVLPASQKGGFDASSILGKRALYDGQVQFCKPLFRKAGGVKGLGGLVFGQKEDAGGFFVDAVDEPERFGCRNLLLEDFHQPGGSGAVFGYGDAGGFVENQNIRILI